MAHKARLLSSRHHSLLRVSHSPSKDDNLQNATARREMRRVVFERAEGAVLLLAVHLCGTLSIKATTT